MDNFKISLKLETKYANKDGKHATKLYLFTNAPKRQKFYSIGSKFVFTPDEWDVLWKTKRAEFEGDDKLYQLWKANKDFFAECRLVLNQIEKEANDIANGLDHFTIDEFEKIMFGGGKGAQKTINFWYEKKIKECQNAGRIGTVVNYESSLKSLLKYAGTKTISFPEITTKWLAKYESWMIDDESKSITTVGIYLRPLRAIFNEAVEANVIKKTLYPFGKRKYQIQEPGAKKSALSIEDLRTFLKLKPNTPEQERAKDMWFFSFYCNGMNPKDIAFLKWENIDGDKISFTRSKTKKTDLRGKQIEIYLNDRAKEILLKHGTSDKSRQNYVFPILTPGSTPIELEKQKNNFTRFVSQHLKKLFTANDLACKISYGNGRHSFSTFALNSNISIEQISEALGHSNVKTTQNYISGFNEVSKRELSNRLIIE